jgi:hypothetical protein
MTSAAYRSADMSGRRAEGRGFGLVIFAAVLVGLVGCFNLIDGIAAIANSHVYVADAHYVFGNLRSWGWITLIIAVVQLLAVLGLNAIDQMFFLPGYPFWSLTIIAADIVAIWGLCAYGGRENIEAAA